MNILITGISGFVGKHLESLLHKYEYNVSGVLRSANKSKNYNSTIYFVDDLCSTDFKELTKGYDVVVHLAALVHQPNQQDVNAYMRLNRDVTVSLAKASIENGVGKLITLSTSHVYEGFDGALTEGQKLSPISPYAQSKYQATERLIQLFSGIPSSCYVIRSPLIYGAGVKGNMRSLSGLIEKLPISPFGLAHDKRSYISVRNLCEFILYLIQNKVQAGVYNVSDNKDLSTKELCHIMAQANNKHVLQLPVPKTIMKILFKSVGNKEHFEKIYGSFRLNIDKALSIGWKPKDIDCKDFVL